MILPWQKQLERLRQALLAQIEYERHGSSQGTIRGDAVEAILRQLLRTYLPTRYAVGSGQVASADGSFSPQMDILVYDRSTYPPLLVNEDGSVVVCAESVYSGIEVKTRFRQHEVAKNFRGFCTVERQRSNATPYEALASYFVVVVAAAKKAEVGGLADVDRLVGVCALETGKSWHSRVGVASFTRDEGNPLARFLEWLLRDCMGKGFVDIGNNVATRDEVRPYFGWEPEPSRRNSEKNE